MKGDSVYIAIKDPRGGDQWCAPVTMSPTASDGGRWTQCIHVSACVIYRLASAALMLAACRRLLLVGGFTRGVVSPGLRALPTENATRLEAALFT